MAHRPSEIARAVNALMDFSNDDQHALLEVIQDYFCEPGSEDEDEEDDSCKDAFDHDIGQATSEGK